MDGWRCGQDWGMGSHPRLHGGRLCAGTTGGDVGMRGEGEHEKGQVSNLPLREGKYRYYVGEGRAVREPPLRRGRTWMVDGWRCGQDWGMDSRLRLHGGRLCAGTTGGDVGMRGEGEHEKGQVSNLPLREGKYRYYVGEGRAVREPPLRRGRMDGGRMALRAGLGDGFPPSSSRGQALRGNNGWGCGNEGRG